MTGQPQNEPIRRYQAALCEHCPECNATEGRPCVALQGREMRGVHRRRDLLFNELEAGGTRGLLMTMLAYVRVSTDEQATKGHGLGAQERALRQEFDRRGWDFEVYKDEGVSAKSLDRPALTRALERIARKDADGLVVAKLDRLTRSVIDFARLLEWFQAADAALIALDLQVDTSMPGGRLVANVFACVAEWERDTIAQRTRDGLAVARSEGRRRACLEDDPELVERIRRMRQAPMTYQQICDVLNAERVPTPRGGVLWRPSSVQGVLGYVRRPSRRTTDLPEVKR